MASDAVGMEARTGIRYGEVRVIIQDGVIVQIERIEKGGCSDPGSDTPLLLVHLAVVQIDREEQRRLR